ncbi:MAG TPA: T9SS type A sorting domain-containing protein [Chitinophagaceae bacterium]|nr:T9SS type A sorting domain-containing protein [Chitinophagaceae bacterium]
MKKIFFPLLVMVIANEGWGQLLQWNTFGNAGTETIEPSVFNDPNITSANLIIGSGVTPAANANRLGGNNWFNAANTNPNTLAEAVTGNDYFQFTVTPNAGFSFTPTSFVFNWDHSATGPASVTLRSSIDGFSTNLGSVTGMPASLSINNTIPIPGLTNLSSATTFRLYGYSATATGGTGGFDVGSNIVNVQLNGTTAAIALPVSLRSFSGYKDGHRNQLRWTTAMELDNLGFEVQRATDGINYSVIDFVNSLAMGGNSSNELNYGFTDNAPPGNRQYYRLRQIDLNSQTKLSTIVLIRGSKPTSLVIDGLFPNPVKAVVNILIAAPAKSKAVLIVSDMAGHIVQQRAMNVETGSNTVQLDVNGLSSGSYMVRINCADGYESASVKFVKQ